MEICDKAGTVDVPAYGGPENTGAYLCGLVHYCGACGGACGDIIPIGWPGMASKVLQQMNDELKISDHALKRYLERVEKWPLHEIYDQILTPEFWNAYNVLRCDGVFPTGRGYYIIVENQVVVTILTATQLKNRKRKRKQRNKNRN